MNGNEYVNDYCRRDQIKPMLDALSVVAEHDHMIDPRMQDAMAKEIGATVTHVESSHVPMVSQPKVVADAISPPTPRGKPCLVAPSLLRHRPARYPLQY
ncbi:hypothetical protein P3T18_003422 [Paraburkholderia sp. GAS199]